MSHYTEISVHLSAKQKIITWHRGIITKTNCHVVMMMMTAYFICHNMFMT